MASKLVLKVPWAASQVPLALTFSSRRALSSLSTQRPTPLQSVVKPTFLPRTALRYPPSRPYTDAPPTPSVQLSPEPRPKRRFRVLRWAWRITYLTTIGLVGWLTYTIYDLRTPRDQLEPDPNKKTLVILGEFPPKTGTFHVMLQLLTRSRNWLGLYFPPQEA